MPIRSVGDNKVIKKKVNKTFKLQVEIMFVT